MRVQVAVVVAIALARPLVADFVLSAGNWTRRTSLFSEQHFIPGYNEAGEWDIITGGNWSETAHIDLRLIGDAAAYICQCPNPPCEPYEAGEPGGPPARPGFNTSVYTCANPGANASFVVCSIFHAERSNITCVSPGFAVSCDIPSFHPDSPIASVDENDVVPSSSFYNEQVTSVSCIARGMGEQDIRRFDNFSNLRTLHTALSVESCSIVCEQICRSVCVHEHRSVHQLFEQLNAWEFDSTVQPNLRRFVQNGTLYEETRPVQQMHGVSEHTAGQSRSVSHGTMATPTLTLALTLALGPTLTTQPSP